MTSIPFGTTDWSDVEPTTHKGEVGVATWRTRQFGDIRVRLVEYSAGYVADHWCRKGNILFCVDGELGTDLADGRSFTLKPGSSGGAEVLYQPSVTVRRAVPVTLDQLKRITKVRCEVRYRSPDGRPGGAVDGRDRRPREK